MGWGCFRAKREPWAALASFLELPILGAHWALLYLLCFEPLEDVMHVEPVEALAPQQQDGGRSAVCMIPEIWLLPELENGVQVDPPSGYQSELLPQPESQIHKTRRGSLLHSSPAL